MKRGDLVKTKCFGPNGTVGEVGIIVRRFPRIVKYWEVLIGGCLQVIAQDGLELVNETRRPSVG